MTIETGAKAGNGETNCAFVQGSTWGTAVAVGAGRGLRITSESIRGGKAPLPRTTLGAPWGDVTDKGAESHRGPIAGDLFYGGNCGEILAYVFGDSGSPTQTPPSTGTSYLHVADLVDSLGDFLTLCIGKRSGQKWWEYDSLMVSRIVLRGGGNGRVTFEVEGIASQLDRDSSTNTTTETDAVTVPTVQAAVRFKDGLFRLNAQAGGALDSSAETDISSFELEIRRALSEDFLADGTDELALPAEEDVCEVMLRVGLRSYDAETWKAAYAAGTEYKADLKLTASGVSAGTGAVPYFEFQFPRIFVMEDPEAPIQGRGRIPHSVAFKAIEASAAPTGMTGVTKPVRMNVMDLDASAYLA